MAEEKEITLGELWQAIVEKSKIALAGWPIIVGAGLMFGAYFFYKAYSRPLVFKSKLTFMLNEDKGGIGVASLLGALGGVIGSGSGDYQLEKILEIARSRRIVSTALFRTSTVQGKPDFFANHFIRDLKADKAWTKDTALADFMFIQSDPAKFSRKENKALLRLHNTIANAKSGLFKSTIDKKSGILTLNLDSGEEQLSIQFLNTLYEEISAFYIKKAILREQSTLDLLTEKRDSISRILNRSDYSVASFDERNKNLLLETARVPNVQNRRNNQVLSLMYGEAIKNAELAEFSLNSKTPFLTLIDGPIEPILPEARGEKKNLLIGCFIGGFLGMLFVFARFFFKNQHLKS